MTIAQGLDTTDLAILNHLADGACAVAPLRTQIPRESLYGRLRQHVAAGWVRKLKQGIWEALPAGIEALTAARLDGRAGSQALLLERIPHLALAPTPVHRSLIVLAVAAVIARTHRIGAAHHAAFLVLGPPRRWKSWLAQLMCYLCGLDPKSSVLYLPTESGGALIQRKGAKGQVTTRRPATLEKFVGLDEIGRRLKPAVIEVLRLLLHGELEIADEAGTIALPAVPMCLANPKRVRKDATWPERLGIDEGALRRAVPADLTDVEIPAAIMTEGDERLDRARELGAIDFPAPPDSDWIPRAETQRQLAQLLDSPERCADVDVTMVAKFATGLSALLPQPLALREALRAYVTAVATLGWARPDWEALLPSIEQPDAAPAPETSAAPTEPNPFDLATQLAPLQHTLDALQLEPDAARGMLELLQRLGPDRVRQLDALERDLGAAALTLEEVRATVAAGQQLAGAAGLSGKAAASALQDVAAGLTKELARPDARGDALADMPGVVRAWAHGGRQAIEWARYRKRMKREGEALAATVAELRANAEQLRADGKRIAAEALKRRDEYVEIEGTLQRAIELRDRRLSEAAHAERQRAAAEQQATEFETQVAFAHDVFRVLRAEIHHDGAWVAAFKRALERAETLEIPVDLDPRSQRVVLALLQKYSPEAIVPRAELDDYVAQIQAQERRRLLTALAPTIELLHSVPTALAPVLNAVQAAAAELGVSPA